MTPSTIPMHPIPTPIYPMHGMQRNGRDTRPRMIEVIPNELVYFWTTTTSRGDMAWLGGWGASGFGMPRMYLAGRPDGRPQNRLPIDRYNPPTLLCRQPSGRTHGYLRVRCQPYGCGMSAARKRLELRRFSEASAPPLEPKVTGSNPVADIPQSSS